MKNLSCCEKCAGIPWNYLCKNPACACHIELVSSPMPTPDSIIEKFREKCSKTFLHDGFCSISDAPPHEYFIEKELVESFLRESLMEYGKAEREAGRVEQLKGTKNRVMYEAGLKDGYTRAIEDAVNRIKIKMIFPHNIASAKHGSSWNVQKEWREKIAQLLHSLQSLKEK